MYNLYNHTGCSTILFYSVYLTIALCQAHAVGRNLQGKTDRQNLPVGQYGKCLDKMLKEEAMGGRGEALSPDLVGVGERKRTWSGNQRDWYLAFALLAQRT